MMVSRESGLEINENRVKWFHVIIITSKMLNQDFVTFKGQHVLGQHDTQNKYCDELSWCMCVASSIIVCREEEIGCVSVLNTY